MADYLVIKGKDRATIEIAQETKVVFPFTFNVVAVKATSGSVTVSLSAGAQSGDDGTDTIAEGDSTVFSQLTAKEIYISGSGTVKVWAGVRPEFCPFSKGGKGGGGSGGDNTHYKGTTTTAIENGSTTNPITIDGESYTAVFGDIAVYNYTEFVFDGTRWGEFGRPFDTTPTSGSANAVTSDGIYQVTPWTRGLGVNSAQKGIGCAASGYGSIASGYQSKALASGAVALGNYINIPVNYNYLHAFGNFNNARENDIFEIGNGSGSSRSNILEANSTSVNINGDIQRDGVGIDDYTTTERKIGKWIDGSDLYQRTFEVTGLTVSSQWVFNENILGTSNIDIKDFKGYTEWSDGTNTTRFDLNFYLSNNIHSLCLNATSDLAISLNHDSGSLIKAVITIKYTKESVQANLMQTAPTEVSETPTVEEDDIR